MDIHFSEIVLTAKTAASLEGHLTLVSHGHTAFPQPHPRARREPRAPEPTAIWAGAQHWRDEDHTFGRVLHWQLGYCRKPNQKERSKGGRDGDEGQYHSQTWAIVIWGTNASTNLSIDWWENNPTENKALCSALMYSIMHKKLRSTFMVCDRWTSFWHMTVWGPTALLDI